MSSAERRAKIAKARAARIAAGENMFNPSVNQRIFGITAEPANPNTVNYRVNLRGNPENPRVHKRLPSMQNIHPNNYKNNAGTMRPNGVNVNPNNLEMPYIEARSMSPGNPVQRTLLKLKGAAPNVTVPESVNRARLGYEIGKNQAKNAANEIPPSNPPNTSQVNSRKPNPVESVDPSSVGCFGGTCKPKGWLWGGRRKSRKNKKSKKSKSRKNKKRRTCKRRRV